MHYNNLTSLPNQLVHLGYRKDNALSIDASALNDEHLLGKLHDEPFLYTFDEMSINENLVHA